QRTGRLHSSAGSTRSAGRADCIGSNFRYMTDHLTRRDFVTAASALAGAALLPAAATAGRAPAGAADGTVVLFQGDSITDAGRDRGVADPNSAGALGPGYPLLPAAAALPAPPHRW